MTIVEETCSLLQCSDWELFKLAFVEEYSVYDEYKIDKYYQEYLKEGTVPFWVKVYQWNIEKDV